MAKLVNTLINGFIVSSKFTGRMIVKKGEEIPEIVEDFVSGFLGYGWKIWRRAGRWILEIDDLIVRKTMTVFELLIQKIRAVKGAIAITQGNGKVASVSLTDTEVLLTIEDDMSFVEHDIILCQVFSGTQIKRYHVEISKVENDVIHIPIEEFDIDPDTLQILNLPQVGDDIVQFGNSSYDEAYKGRHSAIYLHSDESGQPAIDLLEDIYSKDWTGCIKTRIGGAIPGTTDKRGFYTVNGMIKAVDIGGTTIYQFSPDGSFDLGKGKIVYDPKTNKLLFGSGVILGWDNLDDQAKENLKGEPGKDGLNGADGANGKDGTSIIWKGEFASHPANPQNGWAYRNTTDKKSYVYQDGAWYQMTIDGINGQNGQNGISIVWKGESSTPPANPQLNWVYKDTDNGYVYIYNGNAWELMVLDGSDGADGTDGSDGLSVFITYNDSPTEPERPIGNGTTNGWHTNATSSVIWMSQKVAADAFSGEWGYPIKIKGQDANLLPWVEDWNNNKTQIGGEYVVSPKMFSGTKDEVTGNLTGVAMGRECITINGEKRTGIFAVVDDEVVFELDPITREYLFKGKIVTSDQGERIEINPASKDIRIFDESGKLVNTITGRLYKSLDEVFVGSIPTVLGIDSIKWNVISDDPAYGDSRTPAINPQIFYADTNLMMDFNPTYYHEFTINRTEFGTEIVSKVEIRLLKYKSNQIGEKPISDIIISKSEEKSTFTTTKVVNFAGGQSTVLEGGFYYKIEYRQDGIIINQNPYSAKAVNYVVNFRPSFSKISYKSEFFSKGLVLGTSNENVFYVANDLNPFEGNMIQMEVHNKNTGIKIGDYKLLGKQNPEGSSDPIAYGMIPRILCSGKCNVIGNSSNFERLISADGLRPTVAKISDGQCRITYPQAWTQYRLSTSGYVMVTGIGLTAGGINYPIKASVHNVTNTSVDVFLSDDETPNDGSFYFEIKLY